MKDTTQQAAVTAQPKAVVTVKESDPLVSNDTTVWQDRNCFERLVSSVLHEPPAGQESPCHPAVQCVAVVPVCLAASAYAFFRQEICCDPPSVNNVSANGRDNYSYAF